MGKRIDRLVLLALTAFVLYIMFLNAFESIVIACAFTLLCCTVLLRLFGKYIHRDHMTRFQAKELLSRWAYDSDEKAESEILSLLQPDGKMIYFPKHPSSTLGMSDVFSAWKAHREEEIIIIVTTGCADGRAKTFSRTLEKPSVRIMDASKLIPIIRKSDIPVPHIQSGRFFFRKMKEIILMLPGRRPWYKNMLFGLAMMFVYLLTGRVIYLILSIGMLLLAGVGVRIRT